MSTFGARHTGFGQSAFSLVEVLIAMALLAIFVLTITQFYSVMTTSVMSTSSEGDFDTYVSLMAQVLSSDTCALALAKSPTTAGYAYSGAQSDIIPAPTSNPNQFTNVVGTPSVRLSLSRVYLAALSGPAGLWPQAAPSTTPGGPTTILNKYITFLHVEAARIGKAYGGSLSRDFLLAVFSDSSGIIQQCYLDPMAFDACRAIGGIYNSASTPPCTLPFPSPYQTCGPGQYMTGFNSSGSIICAP